MRALNRRVEVDGEPVARVAADALAELGLTSVSRRREAEGRSRSRPARAGLAAYLWAERRTLLGLTRPAPAARGGLARGRDRAGACRSASCSSARGRGAEAVIRAVGVLQTIPGIALLAFMIPLLGIGVVPALVALFLYSLYPILRNTYTGVRDAAPDAVGAALALGMTPRQILRYVRLPLAAPLIMAGIRTAAVINVGTATLAAFIGAGGLGDPIASGLALSRYADDPLRRIAGRSAGAGGGRGAGRVRAGGEAGREVGRGEGRGLAFPPANSLGCPPATTPSRTPHAPPSVPCPASRTRPRRAGGVGAVRRGEPERGRGAGGGESAQLPARRPVGHRPPGGRGSVRSPDLRHRRARRSTGSRRTGRCCARRSRRSTSTGRSWTDGRRPAWSAACTSTTTSSDVIRKHEKTRPDKEDDRTRHVLTLRANAEPVFLTYRGRPEHRGARDARSSRTPPLYDFTAPDGVRHTVWRVPDPRPLVEAFRAGAARLRGRRAPSLRERVARGARAPERASAAPGRRASTTGSWRCSFRPSSCAFCPTTASCATSASLGTRERARAAVARGPCHGHRRSGAAAIRARFCIFLMDAWYRLELDEATIDRTRSRSARSTSRCCRTACSGPMLGIGDPRTDKRIDFVGGIRGTAELERRVRLGRDGHRLLALPDDAGPAHGRLRRRPDHAAQEHVVRAQAAQRALRAYLVGSRERGRSRSA